MLLRSAFVLLLTITIASSYAQQIDEKNFTRYTKLDGLSNNSVMSITQDSVGYLWIGTAKGLNRFDGQSFINIFKNQKDSLKLVRINSQWLVDLKFTFQQRK